MSGDKKEAYRRLFCDEAGGLKPHAWIVLEDLLTYARFFSDTALPADNPGESLLILEGSRAVVRRVLKMSGAGGQTMKRLLEGDKNE